MGTPAPGFEVGDGGGPKDYRARYFGYGKGVSKPAPSSYGTDFDNSEIASPAT